ncbi:hypothetical protein ILYODFUR_035503 [Ilyodon furcidens]|uniref:Uncharacterized protein n=1 Tax=Ilyodon furcidens TaxID=33524 RepID=A0ABV0UQR7_9TELE
MRLLCAVLRQAENGPETMHLNRFILPVTSELRRLLSCVCQNVRPKWMAPTLCDCKLEMEDEDTIDVFQQQTGGVY